jgi:hypothetical protein
MNMNELQKIPMQATNAYTNAMPVTGQIAQLNQWVPDYQWLPQIQVWPSVIYHCSGHIHVFGCEHATTCKCGAATRALPVKACPTCGKKDG